MQSKKIKILIVPVSSDSIASAMELYRKMTFFLVWSFACVFENYFCCVFSVLLHVFFFIPYMICHPSANIRCPALFQHMKNQEFKACTGRAR